MYKVKEIFYTLQGEGANSGRPSVFCRFTGCNLWSGRATDKALSSCWFCDTDFVGTDGPGGGSFRTAAELAQAIANCWPGFIEDKQVAFVSSRAEAPLVVFTGGEPLLQLDSQLLCAIKSLGFSTAVETNGTIAAPEGIDWITVSPKLGTELTQRSGNELKLLYPQELAPESLSELDFEVFYLSPITSPDAAVSEKNIQLALNYCRENPQWRLTMQHHKFWQIP